jgi:HYR domain
MRILFRRGGLRPGLPWVLVAVAAGLASLAGIAASPVVGSTVATGTLEMNASLDVASQLSNCKLVGIATACASRDVDGSFRGLGRVTGSYDYEMDLGPGACESGLAKALSYPIRLEVAGKGAINVVTTEAACADRGSVQTQTQTQAFTVTGGTGIYTGASGSGTLQRSLVASAGGGDIESGIETWNGTLTVPGLEFDVVTPTFVGAKSRTVVAPRHANRVRVEFIVTATDAVAGRVPVRCLPRSGTEFSIGRNRVHCSATDTSANAATASFTITVRQHR